MGAADAFVGQAIGVEFVFAASWPVALVAPSSRIRRAPNAPSSAISVVVVVMPAVRSSACSSPCGERASPGSHLGTVDAAPEPPGDEPPNAP